jgi:DNA repair protein RadC
MYPGFLLYLSAMSHDRPNRPINQWAEDDRPREKLLLKGKQALSNAELIAILIGSGNKELSAVELAQKIMDKAGNNLIELSKFTVSDLTRMFKGIGTAKAVTIVAALELGKRRLMEQALERKQVKSSKDAYEVLVPFLTDLYSEEFRILILDHSNKVTRNIAIGKGGFSGTTADPRKIFKEALDHHATSLILAHNHPSGNKKPSNTDIKLTEKLIEAGKMLDINILDHLIVVNDGYFSFADEGFL